MRIMRRLTIFLVGLVLSVLGLIVAEVPMTYGFKAGNIGVPSTAWYSAPSFDLIFGIAALLLGLVIILLGFRGILITGRIH